MEGVDSISFDKIRQGVIIFNRVCESVVFDSRNVLIAAERQSNAPDVLRNSVLGLVLKQTQQYVLKAL